MTISKLNGLTLAGIMAVDRLVRTHAAYVSDADLRDTWSSFAKVVLDGGSFEGDCDDWAQTTLDILFKLGAPKSRLHRALVSSTGEAIDHMIGIVELDNGQFWTVGDTFGPPEQVDGKRAGPHTIIETAMVSEGKAFRPWVPRISKRETTAASMGMTTSAAGQDFMRAHEKFVAIAYDDKRPRAVLKPGDKIIGTLTWGYGHTGDDVRIGRRLSKAEGEALFARDLAKFEAEVRRMVRVQLTQHQFDALVSFAFNCGSTNLGKSTLLKKVNAGAPDHEIQREFRRWIRSGGEVMPGLVKRRNAEAAMWADEVVTHGATAAMLRAPEISCEAQVEEDKSPGKSADVWLTGLLGGGGISVTVLQAVKDAVSEFRTALADADLTVVYSIAGVAVAVISGVLLVKRLHEIKKAQA